MKRKIVFHLGCGGRGVLPLVCREICNYSGWRRRTDGQTTGDGWTERRERAGGLRLMEKWRWEVYLIFILLRQSCPANQEHRSSIEYVRSKVKTPPCGRFVNNGGVPDNFQANLVMRGLWQTTKILQILQKSTTVVSDKTPLNLKWHANSEHWLMKCTKQNCLE